MTDHKRRLVERVVDAAYLESLSERSIQDLRDMRDDCREGEKELSFERRLCQARIDILSAELERRAGSGGDDLLARLPEILATEAIQEGSPLPARAPDFSIPRNADIPRRRVEEIVGEQTLARLSQLSADEVKGIIATLGDHEKAVSERRRRVHEVMDSIQAEIVRRYTSGEADPAEVFPN
jgi:hypothetical protein